MSTTLASFIQEMSQEMGDWYQADTTGAGSTTTLVDAGLANLEGGGDDDAFQHWYVKVTESGHGAEGQVRRVSSYTASSRTLTVEQAFSATVGSGVAYQLHRVDSRLKARAVNQALPRLIDDLYLPVRDESIVIDNRLSNSDFETFSAGFTDWTEVGSPTVTQETGLVFHGSGSAKVVAGAGAGQLTQEASRNVHEITGKQVVFKVRGYATAADAVRLRLDWDGSSFEDSAYHSGKDQWQLLTAQASVPATASQVKAICEVAAGQTGYFDASYLYHVPVHRYTLPSGLVVLSHVLEQVDEHLMDGPYRAYGRDEVPAPGHRLRIEGKKVLTAMSADSDATEVEGSQARLVLTYALGLLFRMLASPLMSALDQRESYLAEAERWMGEYDSLRSRPGVRMKRLGRGAMPGTAHVERDSGGTYLVFDQLGRTAGPIQSKVHS